MKELMKEKMMTVREISDAMGVPDRTVRESVKRMFPNKGKPGVAYQLTEKEVAVVSADLKRAHNVDLASSRQVVMTELEENMIVAQAVQLLQTRIARLEQESLQNAPKIEFYEAVTGSKDAVEMSAVAKVLDMGIGRNKLFEFLREYKILRSDNTPYQKYIDANWFRVIEQKYSKDGEVHINFKTLVYQKGMDNIRKFYYKISGN